MKMTLTHSAVHHDSYPLQLSLWSFSHEAYKQSLGFSSSFFYRYAICMALRGATSVSGSNAMVQTENYWMACQEIWLLMQ